MNAIPMVAGPKVGKIRVRPFKGSKKRPAFMVRPSLKEVNSRLKKLRREGRYFRGALRRCPVLDESRQIGLNQALLQVKQAREGVMRYVENLTRVE